MTAIYADHGATTPVSDVVLEAMAPYDGKVFGNPSSIHAFGQEAKRAVETARRKVAAWVGAQPAEVIFTSGGTEADNLAVIGLWSAHRDRGRRVVLSNIEHHAVLHTEAILKLMGCEVTLVPTDEHGIITPEALEGVMDDDVALVSVMTANNEVGTLQPLPALSEIVRRHGALFHTDAVQAAGYLPIDMDVWGVDALSLSAHKIYGPKGCGALVLRSGLAIDPIHVGGGHERGRRAGTENVRAIVGFGAAAEETHAERAARAAWAEHLRDRLIEGLLDLPDTRLNGDHRSRLPNNVNVSFAGIDGETMLLNLDLEGIAASSGSACTSGSLSPSHVLMAMGRTAEEASGAVRFTLGKGNTEADVERIVEACADISARVRRHKTREVMRHG